MGYVYLIGVAVLSIISGMMFRPEQGETLDDVLQDMVVVLLWPFLLLVAIGVCINHLFDKWRE